MTPPTNQMGKSNPGNQGNAATVRKAEPAEVAAAARLSLARWFATGRQAKGMSIDEVARITKIQHRALERIESGQHEGLPAEVFVKGFVRSFARAIGLDEQEALLRYSACGTGASVPTAAARALVESMSELAPVAAAKPTAPVMLAQPEPVAVVPAPPVLAATAEPTLLGAPVVEHVLAEGSAAMQVADVEAEAEADVVATAPEIAKKKNRNRKKKGGKASNHASVSSVAAIAAATPTMPSTAPSTAIEVIEAPAFTAETEVAAAVDVVAVPTEVWVPKMPPLSIPWTRPSVAAPALPVVPTLVIDDADPESAERDMSAERDDAKAPRRSLIPSILLENDDRGRQGGLTLAVIILLIAATLTLSYLMRRPGAGGDGMTLRLSTPTTLVG